MVVDAKTALQFAPRAVSFDAPVSWFKWGYVSETGLGGVVVAETASRSLVGFSAAPIGSR